MAENNETRQRFEPIVEFVCDRARFALHGEFAENLRRRLEALIGGTGQAAPTPPQPDNVERLREAWEHIREDTFQAHWSDYSFEKFYDAIAGILGEPTCDDRVKAGDARDV